MKKINILQEKVHDLNEVIQETMKNDVSKNAFDNVPEAILDESIRYVDYILSKLLLARHYQKKDSN